MSGALTLTCRKCTREGRFTGASTTEAAAKALASGWVLTREVSRDSPPEYACPKCPATRSKAA